MQISLLLVVGNFWMETNLRGDTKKGKKCRYITDYSVLGRGGLEVKIKKMQIAKNHRGYIAWRLSFQVVTGSGGF